MKHFYAKGRAMSCFRRDIVTKLSRYAGQSIHEQPLGSITKYIQIYFRVKLLIYMVLLLATVLCFNMFTHAQELSGNQGAATGHVQQPRTVLRGEVRSAVDGRPIDGASIKVKGGKESTITDGQGAFSLTTSLSTGKLTVSHLGFLSKEIQYEAQAAELHIALVPSDNMLEEVDVVSTGYQKLPKERATGSFEFIDSTLFNRKVSTDFVSRLEDVVPGLSTNKDRASNRGDLLNMNIRGESSINSNIWPLVVIDGVPYENNMADYGMAAYNNINPNDIENITLLKDAAAASIWGSQSGNGVIVITTKRGKFNQKAQLSFNSNFTTIDKPDLYKYKNMSTSDHIELMRLFYDKGRYNSRFNRWNNTVPPVVWLFKNATDKKISEEQLNTELDRLRQIDQRDDFMKYIYRRQSKQQHSLRLTQGSDRISYSLGLGYDRNLGALVTESYQRINTKIAVQARPVKSLLLDFSVAYTESDKEESWDLIGYNQLALGASNYPYLELADEWGNPLPVEISGLNPGFIDTVGGGLLQSFTYRPLEELYRSKQNQKQKELLMQLNAKYQFGFGLSVSGMYAYQRNHNPISNWRSGDSYELRSQANSFASWNDHEVIWNQPLGDYLYGMDWNHYSHQGRLNLMFDRTFGGQHAVSFLAGLDARELQRDMKTYQYYGYDPLSGSFQQVQFGKEIRRFNGKSGVAKIVDRSRIESLTNRYLSFYMNGSYTFKDRYIWSGSMRKDASNLFGVKANDRGQPFWSTGLAWLLSKEDFMSDKYFNYLKLRATYGYNGNVNNSISAYPIMAIESQPHYITGETYGTISRPPNPNLRWERVGNLNFGLDFATADNLFSGSVEYYHKRAIDLIAQAEVDPTVGFSHLTVNSADLLTKGWDISLNAAPIKTKRWGWNSNLVFAHLTTKVTKAYLANDIASLNVSYANSVIATPIEGMELYSLLTYKWAGLNPADGTPQAYLNGEISDDYIAIQNTKVSELQNHGTQRPRYFGSWRNSVRFKNIELSWNISYQLGHKFIRESFDNDVFLELGAGHSDYSLRWQKPGDEAWTDVPAFTYPNKFRSSPIYRSSSVLVERGDQIKLRDIQASMGIPGLSRYGINNFRLYAYAQHIGTIWRANNKGIDSEYGASIPDPLSLSLGINFNL
ncbi:SusC/RagA family TonB-linked outer membrane protein [Sphingobacterium sp. SYP-B4668]|uniref:SusC/RagA family TonB-linked outer membrane protein n=1 Tax=Sphingobacterium sp. SYP-B4668 TaxID=2996035 RepID=UPI0022DD5D35|nr:SusC/RagA family TonB-linked outer membrane protein [Sphingobacterium sp. SYP-B4668]